MNENGDDGGTISSFNFEGERGVFRACRDGESLRAESAGGGRMWALAERGASGDEGGIFLKEGSAGRMRWGDGCSGGLR